MIHRYTLMIGDNRSYQTGMERHSKGEYVKYEDYKARVNALELELEKTRNERNAAHQRAVNSFARSYGRSKY